MVWFWSSVTWSSPSFPPAVPSTSRLYGEASLSPGLQLESPLDIFYRIYSQLSSHAETPKCSLWHLQCLELTWHTAGRRDTFASAGLKLLRAEPRHCPAHGTQPPSTGGPQEALRSCWAPPAEPGLVSCHACPQGPEAQHKGTGEKREGRWTGMPMSSGSTRGGGRLTTLQ